MTDEHYFKNVESRFEDTWPQYSWAPLVKLVLASAAQIEDWRRARRGRQQLPPSPTATAPFLDPTRSG